MTTVHFTDPDDLVDIVETADAASVLVPLRSLDAVIQQMAHNMHAGRLSISPTDPVGQSATPSATLYLLPYLGNVSAQRNGAGDWIPRQIPDAGVSLNVAALAADTCYDIFEYDNAGNIALEATAWASGTARATSLGFVDGVYVKTGAGTRKYRGSIRTVNDGGTTKAIDSSKSDAKLLVWNSFNRVLRRANFVESTASWGYTTGAIRFANNNSNAKIEIMAGLAEDGLFVALQAAATGMSSTVWTGIGLDSSSAMFVRSRATVAASMLSQYALVPAIGHHTLTDLEYGATGATFVGSLDHSFSALWRA